MTIKKWCDYIGKWALDKGWHESFVIDTKLLLIHSEISEAFEEVRNGKLYDEIYYSKHQDVGVKAPIDKPEGFIIEIADAVIRIFDLCSFLNIDLEKAIKLKMAYNERRPYRHGGKLA